MSFIEVAAPVSLASKPRIQPDALVRYTVENNCILLGKVIVTAPGACEWEPSTDESIPVGNNDYYLFAVVITPIGAADLNLIISGNKGGSGLVSGYTRVNALSTFDAGFIFTGGSGWNSVAGVTCTGGTANDWVYIYAVPDPDTMSELFYIRSFDLDEGPFMLPIADKYEPAKVHIHQRREPTFNITGDYYGFENFDNLRGREVTICIEMRPYGLSAVGEYIILPKAAVSADSSAPDNAMITSTASGSEQRLIKYSPGV